MAWIGRGPHRANRTAAAMEYLTNGQAAISCRFWTRWGSPPLLNTHRSQMTSISDNHEASFAAPAADVPFRKFPAGSAWGNR
jgi:hypothetical protein